MTIVPDPSAASWSRRKAVMGKRATSATTAPRPPCRRPSFKAGMDGLLVTAFEINDAVGVQPGLRERRR
jgi:hypothetical protein